MPELIVPFYPGWVHEKDSFQMSESFSEIVKFYVFGNPCENTTSSGQTMVQRGWRKDIWKTDLRVYLLSVAGLSKDTTYKKVKRLDEMTKAVSTTGLGGHFHTMRDSNRVIFYNDGKRVDFLSIIYYIRCAIAHGRFESYQKKDGNVVYAFEAVTKKRGTNTYIVRARMILSEKTLVEWMNTIKNGDVGYSEKKTQLDNQIQGDIKHLIKDSPSLRKAEISEKLPYEANSIYAQLKVLVDSGEVLYDRSKNQWKCMNNS